MLKESVFDHRCEEVKKMILELEEQAKKLWLVGGKIDYNNAVLIGERGGTGQQQQPVFSEKVIYGRQGKSFGFFVIKDPFLVGDQFWEVTEPDQKRITPILDTPIATRVKFLNASEEIFQALLNSTLATHDALGIALVDAPKKIEKIKAIMAEIEAMKEENTPAQMLNAG